MTDKPFGNYCHKHGKGMFSRCQACIDEWVALGIQADKDRIAELVRENERLRENAKIIYELEQLAARSNNELLVENERLANDMSRCYRMLQSDPDVKGALFKAENILRESLADRGAK